MKEGSSVFAPVGKSFSGPPWRQALIVQKLDSERWLLVVRVEGPTTDQEGSFELEGRTFMVVEGSTPSMRKACQDPFLALEVQTASLQAAASEFLNSHHDLVFTTASEEAGPSTRTVGSLPVAKRSSKVESDSDSSEGEVDLLDDLKRMQKSWQGRGTNDDDSSSDAKVAAKRSPKTSGRVERQQTKRTACCRSWRAARQQTRCRHWLHLEFSSSCAGVQEGKAKTPAHQVQADRGRRRVRAEVTEDTKLLESPKLWETSEDGSAVSRSTQ